MQNNNLSSSLLSEVVDHFATLPGIGKKSALRLALHLLKQPHEKVACFSASIINMKEGIRFCKRCNMISDLEICPICTDSKRDQRVICVVESLRDVISIEATEQYRGLYHVLGGIISPMDGIGPSDLTIDSLIERAGSDEVREIILALSTTMEGETTSFYLYKKLADAAVSISTIARGVGFGDDLEYTDELTLGRSITNRQPFKPNN